jgi:hypothetical protein
VVRNPRHIRAQALQVLEPTPCFEASESLISRVPWELMPQRGCGWIGRRGLTGGVFLVFDGSRAARVVGDPSAEKPVVELGEVI